MVLLGDLQAGERFALAPAGETWEVVEAASPACWDPLVRRPWDSHTTSFARTKLVYHGAFVVLGDLQAGERLVLAPGGELWEVVDVTSHGTLIGRLRDGHATTFARTKLVYRPEGERPEGERHGPRTT